MDLFVDIYVFLRIVLCDIEQTITNLNQLIHSSHISLSTV